MLLQVSIWKMPESIIIKTLILDQLVENLIIQEMPTLKQEDLNTINLKTLAVAWVHA